ncbi:hypothetical protein CXB51_006221 [Gossypium anomalum]|uniref:Integrase catalytic domain-containing protein n=1 Tax=Gossypium anomalum TaxID=47600 RepID=A0A8J5ZXE0_9ROSI|nr:hypothetical protein CXB51_006221 [Gossypium anomalum]
MANTYPVESDSVEPHGSVFLGDRVVTLFPRHEVRLILRGYGLFGLHDGSLTAPARFVQSSDGDLVVNPAISVFDHQDSLLSSWLLSTIGSSFLSSFTDVRTARDVWIVATNLFAADSSVKQSQLHHELHSLRKCSLSIRSYVNKITSLCALLAVLRSQISEDERTAVLLAGLSSEFDAIIFLCLSPRACYPFNASSMLCSSVKPANFDSSAKSTVGMAILRSGVIIGTIVMSNPQSMHRWFDGVSPYGQNWRLSVWSNSSFDDGVPRGSYAGDPFVSHEPRQYDNVGTNSFGNGREFDSGQYAMCFQFNNEALGQLCGNTVREVPWQTKLRARVFSIASSLYDSSQFVGLPSRLPGLHASDYSGATKYDSNFNSTDSCVPVEGTSWCPDSRATHHVCRNGSDLYGTTPYTGNSSLLMGNGVSTPISSIGSTTIPTTQKLLHLLNVLCVPSIRKNLLFVSKFVTDNNVFFDFHPSYCVIKDIQTQEILMWGQVRDGLYQFSAGLNGLSLSAHSAVAQCSSTADDVFSLWHKRLGHPAPNIVKAVLEKCHITVNKSLLDNVCVACQKGKSHKLPFPRSSTEYVDLSKLVVSDVWGSTVVPCEGNLYYVPFVDMTSRFTWVYLINRKSQAGILHRVSCPYMPKQNGVAERKHRHVVETGLALLAQANPLMKYWGYAFCSAIHLINRLPTPVLTGQSPYQRLFGHEPTYDHLRVAHYKGYFCLTPDDKVIVSRYVVFDETHFLFSLLSSTSAQPSPGNPTYVPVVRSFTTTDTGSPSAPPPEGALGILAGNPAMRDSSTPYDAFSRSSINLLDDSGTSVREAATSGTSVRDEATATSIVPAERVSLLLVSTTNTHGMITRSKAGIFKPKALCADNIDLEPSSVKEALAHPDWRSAVIGCKWLFKIKKNPDGTINRCKTRLVAKGCSQVPGCDFTETFSLVVKTATIRVILSIAVTKGWPLRQVDVNNAFLNGDLVDDVYMQQPPGFVQHGSISETLVCHPTKVLYGLRQAPRAWFDKLKQFLISTSFTLSKSDASLFVRSASDYTLYVLVYVDDIVITGSYLME